MILITKENEEEIKRIKFQSSEEFHNLYQSFHSTQFVINMKKKLCCVRLVFAESVVLGNLRII